MIFSILRGGCKVFFRWFNHNNPSLNLLKPEMMRFGNRNRNIQSPMQVNGADLEVLKTSFMTWRKMPEWAENLKWNNSNAIYWEPFSKKTHHANSKNLKIWFVFKTARIMDKTANTMRAEQNLKYLCADALKTLSIPIWGVEPTLWGSGAAFKREAV